VRSTVATIAIDGIAAGGDGIGRIDRLAVFVPRTAPGDVAEVRYQLRGRLGRGEVSRLLRPSVDRVAPACPHYDGDDCGGCQIQHLAYQAQLEAKRRIVLDAFKRIARRDVDVPPVVPSPRPWRYRSRLTLALRRHGGRWTMGLHSRLDVNRVFDLRSCPITDDRVVHGWSEVAAAGDLLPAASALRGTVRLSGERLSFVLEGGTSWPGAGEFAERCTSIGVVRWRPEQGELRVMSGTNAVAGEEAFDQVNREVAERARSDLVERTMAVHPGTVVDAYAGVGHTSRLLARHGVQVTAIEIEPAATVEAAKHLQAPSRVVTGRVEDVLASALPADVVIVNPPRAGLDAHVTSILESPARPRRLLYMSCDPATLARDVQRLPGYRVAYARAFDMFPQTAHVEVVAELVPEGS
jgi:23S rRNA (uracil1939-C5)-methyltransferase